jgi:hypothetical protein
MKSFRTTLISLIFALPTAGTAFAQDGAPFTNSVGMEFAAIPAGEFLMGSPVTDRAAQSAEKPQHKVTITRPFHTGKFEVTQAQWEAVIGSSPFDRDRSNRCTISPAWRNGSPSRTTPPMCLGTMRRNSSPRSTHAKVTSATACRPKQSGSISRVLERPPPIHSATMKPISQNSPGSERILLRAAATP